MEIAIKHTCGHESHVSLSGLKMEAQQGYIEKREGSLCPECFKIKKKQERLELAGVLPPLVGTDKQVRWAEVIRQIRYDEMSAHRAAVEEFCAAQGVSTKLTSRYLKVLDIAWKLVLKNSFSSFWIEKAREMDAVGLAIDGLLNRKSLATRYRELSGRIHGLVEDTKRWERLSDNPYRNIELHRILHRMRNRRRSKREATDKSRLSMS